MKFYLSVFGGGTTTEMVVFNEKCKILSSGISGGVNLHYESYQDVMKNLSDAIVQCTLNLYKYGFEGRFEGIYGTLITPNRDIEIKSCMESIGYTVGNYTLESEHYCYLVSASFSDKGGVAISGTGSLAAYHDSDNDYITIGGYGIPFGDDGSSTWIGIKGLNAVSKAAMGWGEKTVLFDLLYENDENNRCNVYSKISEEEKKYNEKRYMYVAFSRKVIQGAELGDKVCINILKEAGEIMAMQMLSAMCMYKKGFRGMGYTDYFPQQGLLEAECDDFGQQHVYVCGKTWVNNPVMYESFKNYIHSKQPSIICEHAKYKVAYAGLILYAKEHDILKEAKNALKDNIFN